MGTITTTSRIRGLDGIRAFSVLAVFAHHTGLLPVHGGFIGVDVFFVLSGFLITRILRDEFDGTGSIDFQNFYVRRAKRLLPALAVFLTFIFGYWVVFQPVLNPWWEIGPAALYFMNWARAYNLYDATLTGHTWTLSIEEQFYLIWPLALLAILRLKGTNRAIATLALALTAIVWRLFLMHSGANGARIYTGFDTHSEGLLLGATLALMPEGLVRRVGSLLWLPGALFLIASLFVAKAADFAAGGYGYAVTSMAAFSIISKVISAQDSVGVKLLSIAPLAWLGRLSYGIYLWHYAVIKIMLYSDYDPIMGFFGSTANPVIAMVSTTFLISVGLAALSWYLVESPILGAQRFTSRQPAPQLS